METVEKLTEEVNLLLDLSKDLSFDSSVMEDAKILIDIKNKSIIDMGGNPVIIEVKEEIGITKDEKIDRLKKVLTTLSLFKDRNETAKIKYISLNKIFQMISGVTFEQYKENGNKFFYGGVLSGDNNFILSNLKSTNEFTYLKQTQDDKFLRYTTPDKSVLYSVLLPSMNVAYALVYPLNNNTVIDFYKDEDLSKSLNLTYSFSSTKSNEVFANEYAEMMKKLYDVEKKYY